MMKLEKLIMLPRSKPACWKAQGKDTTAEPIIVFHTENIMTNELYFSPGSARKSIQSEIRKHENVRVLTFFGEWQTQNEELIVNDMRWRSQEIRHTDV